jgi:hypothetical protein
MAEVNYYKDFKHNYLILKNENAQGDVYQCRMITGNRIEGLLACQERHINDELLLYYEITSRQSLQSIYESSRMGMKELNGFFMQLQRVLEGISRYLLDERYLMLKPEFIFMDIETKELSFLYYPFEPEEDYMTVLLEFLADRVDSEDKDAVRLVYKMLDLCMKEQFVLDEVLKWFEEDYAEGNETEGREPEYQDFPPQEIPLAPKEENKKVTFIPTIGILRLFLPLLPAAVLFCIYKMYQLSDRELVWFWAALLLDGVIFLAGICFFLYKTVKDKKTEKEEEGLYREQSLYEQVNVMTQQSYGNTVFIPWMENCENKLYGTGKGNKNHIDLNRLPLTVGKLAGSVDMVIDDSSISRRHVKFAREGNRIFMTDLNSTNGTFKNGLRLLPNTSEVLEPGDEIRLGKLKFIYR